MMAPMNAKTTITIDHAAAAPGTDAASSEPSARHVSAFDLVAATPWAIEPDMLDTIRAIALRKGDGVEAVEARAGRPLQNSRSVTVRDRVAVVPITGPIFRYANLFTQISGATSLDMLAKDFTAALDDPKISAIVLDINSPGGQAAGISDFAHMVHTSAKPVTAFIDGMAASAAYWIAAAASDVVISKSGMAGNVGAVLGIDLSKDPTKGEIVSSQSPNKRPDPRTPEGKAQLQAMVDALAQVFIDDVAAYRGMTPESVVQDFGGGGVSIGAQAVALGMADRMGTLEGVIAELNQSATPGAARPSFTSQENTMSYKSHEELRAAHPELCASLIAAAVSGLTAESLAGGNAPLHAALLGQGASAERERIQSVEAQHMPGHDALIATLKYDGKTSGPEAAMQVLAADKALLNARHEQMKKDAPAPVPNAAAPNDAANADANAGLPVEERCKAAWEKDADLRTEFGGDFTTYLAYAKASDAGRVKVLGNRGK